jgi:hypothetical protein
MSHNPGNMTLHPSITRLVFALCFGACTISRAADPDIGPLFDHFDLTLAPGERTEAVGPFYYNEQKDSQHLWAIPPLFSWTRDPGTDSEEIDFAYPLLTYDRFGGQFRWQLFQLLSFAGSPTQTEDQRTRVTIFPFYFQQRSSDPAQSYTALFPIYGHLLNRLFRDEIFFVMFPIYGQTKKREVVTDNYFYPFFHIRRGPAVRGWQFLPFYGQEHREVTTRTNRWNDLETVPGHDQRFIMWPFFIEQTTGIGTENAKWVQASLPIYSLERAPQRDVTTIVWPFFSRIEDREKKYIEWQMPWPLIIKTRGEGKTTTRVFPFFSHAQTATLESAFYFWPIYKYNRVHSEPLDRRRTRILFFLYSDTVAKNTETGAFQRRHDFWPLFNHRTDFNGNNRWQIFAPVEPVLANNKSLERDYSPLWSVWRSESNPKAGTASQSLLWNLYRREATPEAKKCSLLFGLFQYHSDADGKQLRLFYIPMGKAK